MNCHIYYLFVCSFDAFLYVHQLCSMTEWMEHLSKNKAHRQMDDVCEEDNETKNEIRRT